MFTTFFHALKSAGLPVTLKEYLALGFPIVATRFPMLAPYEGLVLAADDHEGFLAQLAKALGEHEPRAALARRESVRHDSWTALSDRVAAWLGLEQTAACAE